jgi:hypothetical protein
MREKDSRVAGRRRTNFALRVHRWCIGCTSTDQLGAIFTLRSSI